MLSHFSHVWLFVTLWTVAHQAPLSMGFSSQEYWSELPCPLPGDLLDPAIEPASLMSPALAGGFFTTGVIWEVHPIKYRNPIKVIPTIRCVLLVIKKDMLKAIRCQVLCETLEIQS